jgi:hypothetical protein
VEKGRGNVCWKPRVFNSFRVEEEEEEEDDDDDDDESDNQINTVHVLPAYYVKIHFNIILKPKPILS